VSGILAILERKASTWNRMSWEALASGAQLSSRTGEPLICAAVGKAEGAVPYAVDRAYAVEHELLAKYTADGFSAALEQIIRELAPSHVVFPHTYQVRDFAPALAARFDEMLIADVVAFGDGVFVRQLLQGKLHADYQHTGAGPCFVSVQSGAFSADALPAGSCGFTPFRPTLRASQLTCRPGDAFCEAEKTVDLTSAALIVSVGRGIKQQDNIPMIEELAKALGAELAASRSICDNGWLPMKRQVGSSGQTVSPKLYLAVGISGAIQHLVGMKASKTVIAINKDPAAPIFEVADFGVVGDLFDVVPALISAIKEAKAG